MQEDRKVVREFNRVLKLGGICVVTVPINPELWDLWDEMAGHIKRYKKQELIELFEGNGFKIEKLNFWGFLLMRFYHRTIFLLWAKITRFKKDSERNRCTLTKIEKKYTGFFVDCEYI